MITQVAHYGILWELTHNGEGIDWTIDGYGIVSVIDPTDLEELLYSHAKGRPLRRALYSRTHLCEKEHGAIWSRIERLAFEEWSEYIEDALREKIDEMEDAGL